MHPPGKMKLEAVYPSCRSAVDPDIWEQIVRACPRDSGPEGLPKTMMLRKGDLGLPDFLPELARLELVIYKVRNAETEIPRQVDQLGVNPSLQLIQLSWKHLPSILKGGDNASPETPEPGEEYVLVWQDPKTGCVKSRAASEEDLLVLKIVVEGTDPQEVATTGNLPVGAVDAAIHRGVLTGVLVAPMSRIRRDPTSFPVSENTDESFLSSPVFTLQLHITQACDLHCKHCYDRSNRSALELDRGIKVLDDLRTFCKDRHVRGQVSFTGGNPLLHPQFFELYQAASQRGLAVAILGNPSPLRQMEALLSIRRPVFFQVSLEGLREHNDMIRGSGHFDRTIEFLKQLKGLDISSKVMLTLTKGNMDQVIPLGELLRDLTDDFTFNRLSMVGEGANLQLPLRDDFAAFLEAYMKASENNQIMGWKDNFINIVCHEKGVEPFGGCTGYGCGAAFNFMAVLSDGEAHACRKFPSPIGNVFEKSIADIYDSETAHRYRSGPEACRPCPIRLVCRGCLAVAYSHGIDVFKEHDPYCFIGQSPVI